MNERLFGVAAFAVVAAALPARATDTIAGRWAADPAACAGFGATPDRSPLVVTSSAVRWLNESCRIARAYKTGDTVHLQAICPGAGGERSIPVSLRRHGGRLLVRWDRGRSSELHRCR